MYLYVFVCARNVVVSSVDGAGMRRGLKRLDLGMKR